MAENSFKEVLARLTPEELRLSMDNSESFSMRGMLRGLRRLRGERPLSEAMLEYIEALEARYGRELDERDAMRALDDYDWSEQGEETLKASEAATGQLTQQGRVPSLARGNRHPVKPCKPVTHWTGHGKET